MSILPLSDSSQDPAEKNSLLPEMCLCRPHLGAAMLLSFILSTQHRGWYKASTPQGAHVFTEWNSSGPKPMHCDHLLHMQSHACSKNNSCYNLSPKLLTLCLSETVPKRRKALGLLFSIKMQRALSHSFKLASMPHKVRSQAPILGRLFFQKAIKKCSISNHQKFTHCIIFQVWKLP